jgi:hypothetical protein
VIKNDPYRYRVEQLPNGLIRVFDYASKLSACYNADGTYRHGDLRNPTLTELIGDDLPSRLTEKPLCAELS